MTKGIKNITKPFNQTIRENESILIQLAEEAGLHPSILQEISIEMYPIKGAYADRFIINKKEHSGKLFITCQGNEQNFTITFKNQKLGDFTWNNRRDGVSSENSKNYSNQHVTTKPKPFNQTSKKQDDELEKYIKIFNEATETGEKSAYAIKKGMDAKYLKSCKLIKGSLWIPRSKDAETVAIKIIQPDGSKWFAPGSKPSNSYTYVKGYKTSALGENLVLIAEGDATLDAGLKAGGACGYAMDSASNLPNFNKELLVGNHKACFLVDNDNKKPLAGNVGHYYALKAAKNIDASLKNVYFVSSDQDGDISDVYLRGGSLAVAELIQNKTTVLKHCQDLVKSILNCYDDWLPANFLYQLALFHYAPVNSLKSLEKEIKELIRIAMYSGIVPQRFSEENLIEIILKINTRVDFKFKEKINKNPSLKIESEMKQWRDNIHKIIQKQKKRSQAKAKAAILPINIPESIACKTIKKEQLKSNFDHLIEHGAINIIRAGTGLGKTNLAIKASKKYKCPMVVTPIISLAKSAAERFGFDCYDDMDAHEVPEKGFSICSNSLIFERFALAIKESDFVIFDEETQQLDFTESESVVNGKEVARKKAKIMGDHSKTILILEAHYPQYVIDFICEHSNGKKINYIDVETENRNINCCILDQSSCINRILEENKKGNKLLILTDCAKKLLSLEQQLSGLGITITSENSKESGRVDFFKKPNEKIHHYAWLGFSPAVKCGLSIESEVENLKVFGLFQGIVKPSDVIQMVSRYRPIKEIILGLKQPENIVYDMDAETIYNKKNGKDSIDMLHAKIESTRRSVTGKNFVQILIETLKLDGFNVLSGYAKKYEAQEGRKKAKECSALREKNVIDGILKAKTLTPEAFVSLKNDSKRQGYIETARAIDRHHIENMAGMHNIGIDEIDFAAKYSTNCSFMFETLTANDESLEAIKPDLVKRKHILNAIFKALNINLDTGEGSFDENQARDVLNDLREGKLLEGIDESDIQHLNLFDLYLLKGKSTRAINQIAKPYGLVFSSEQKRVPVVSSLYIKENSSGTKRVRFYSIDKQIFNKLKGYISGRKAMEISLLTNVKLTSEQKHIVKLIQKAGIDERKKKSVGLNIIVDEGFCPWASNSTVQELAKTEGIRNIDLTIAKLAELNIVQLCGSGSFGSIRVAA